MWVCLAWESLFFTESNWGKTAACCEAWQRSDERKKLMYFWHPRMHREPHCWRHYRFIPELFFLTSLIFWKSHQSLAFFNIRFFVLFLFRRGQEPCNDTVTFHANKQASQRPSGLQLVYFPSLFPFFMSLIFDWQAQIITPRVEHFCMNFWEAKTCHFFTICLLFWLDPRSCLVFCRCSWQSYWHNLILTASRMRGNGHH